MEFRSGAKITVTCFAFMALLAGSGSEKAFAASNSAASEPFVCTPGGGSDDATSKFVTQKGSQFFQMTVAKNGVSSAGIEISQLPDTFTSVGFDVTGTADATSGPFISLITPNGVFTVPVSKGRVVKRNAATGSKQMAFAKALFKNTAEPTEIVIQLFPNSRKVDNVRMSAIHVNTVTTRTVLETLEDCPIK